MYGFQQPTFIILLFIKLGNQAFRFKVSNKIATKLLKVAALSSEGQGRITSAFAQLLAVVQSLLSVACDAGLLHRVSHDMTPGWFPQREQSERGREGKGETMMEAKVFLKAKLEVTFHHFCHILLVLSKSQSLAHVQ